VRVLRPFMVTPLQNGFLGTDGAQVCELGNQQRSSGATERWDQSHGAGRAAQYGLHPYFGRRTTRSTVLLDQRGAAVAAAAQTPRALARRDLR
jgi:hypothetical protein